MPDDHRIGPRSLLDGLLTAMDPIGTLGSKRLAGGDTFDVTLFPAGRVVAVADRGLAQQVLLLPRHDGLAGHANGATLPLLAPSSVLHLDGAANAERRALLEAPLDRLTAAAVERAKAATHTLIGPPWPRPILLQMQDLAIDILLPLFVDERDTAYHLLRSAVRAMTAPLAMGGVFARAPLPSSRSPLARLFLRRRATVVALFRDSAHLPVPPGRRPPLLHALVGGEGGLSVDQAAEEVATLLLAVHQPLGVAATWAVYEVARSEEWTHAVTDGDDGAVAAIVHEILRWRPPIVGAFRTAAAEMQLGQRSISAGTILMVPIPLLHGVVDAGSRPRGDTEELWLPFGDGDRRCLGYRLAPLVIGALLKELFAAARVSPVGPKERPALLATTLVPRLGALLKINERRS